MRNVALVVVAVIVLGACASPTRAPVVDRGPGAQGQAQAQAQAQRPLPTAPLAPPIKPPDSAVARADSYVVRRGDTLYSIALDSGHDYREIAAWNNITDPNVIREGQVLALRPPSADDVQVRPIGPAGGVQVRPLGEAPKPAVASSQPPTQQAPAAQVPADLLVTEPKAQKLPYSEDNLALLSRPRVAPGVPDVRPPAPEAKPALAEAKPPADTKPSPQSNPPKQESTKAADEPDAVEWSWPANGKILAPFSDPANKGVDIAGSRGDPVQASGAGRVVYIGEGLRGYGKLVIIKHNDTYLSAYAHNDAILVKEGQSVSRGQKIAEMGSTGTDQPKLHFEIRRLGKPVDPSKFLPDRR